MKSTFIKISKPCSEKWEKMQSNELGNFCDLCSKTVIDFTQLNQEQIATKMKQANGNICAKVTQTQLNIPLLDFEVQKQYDLRYSKVAASLLMATSLMTIQTSHAENNRIGNPIEQTTAIHLKNQSKYSKANPEPSISNDSTTLKGKIISEEEKTPIKNVKITFVTTQKLITTYSQEDGTFSIEIPTELIDDKNVIRVSYIEVNNNETRGDYYTYEENDLILTKEDFYTTYLVKAQRRVFSLGGISYSSEYERIPIVIDNGVEIKYREFIKAQQDKKSSCSLVNKDYLYFQSEIAIAIYGKKAKHGLYILTEKAKK